MCKLEETSLIYEEYIHNMTTVIFGSRKQAIRLQVKCLVLTIRCIPEVECTKMQTLNTASDSDRPSALISSLRDNKENVNVSIVYLA